MASASASLLNHTSSYDVFLSFRGEDTRNTFADHLYAALVRAGLRTFRDNDEIDRGQQLKPEIERAIKESRASVVVLSEKYANSGWCLDELLLILEQRRSYNHFVLPVFYHVDPSDVRNQRQNFAIKVDDEVEGSKWTEYNVDQWKAALTEVANLTGMVAFGTFKSFLTHYKTNLSGPNFVDFPAPLKSGEVHAATRSVSAVNKYEKLGSRKEGLPAGLTEELMPKHIAFIMDGNRRWAAEKGLSPMAGHSAMRIALKPLLRECSELKIKAVSIYAFSTENWNRPTKEVDFLMDMFEDLLKIDGNELVSLGCRVSVMGNKTELSETLQKLSSEIEEKSRVNLGTHLNFAINYSGKYDILHACQSIATKVRDGLILPNQIDENSYEQELGTKSIDFPSLDLVIRTSGEIRLSNFMLWQMAYSELYFVKKYFPDFGKDDLIRVLLAFQKSRTS